MRKTTLKRLSINGVLTVCVAFISLSVIGRFVGSWSLPWSVARVAPFGNRGWLQAFDWAHSDGWSKEKVLKAVRPPDLVCFEGTAYESEYVDLLESRKREVWVYWPPESSSDGAAIFFIENEVAKP